MDSDWGAQALEVAAGKGLQPMGQGAEGHAVGVGAQVRGQCSAKEGGFSD